MRPMERADHRKQVSGCRKNDLDKYLLDGRTPTLRFTIEHRWIGASEFTPDAAGPVFKHFAVRATLPGELGDERRKCPRNLKYRCCWSKMISCLANLR